MIMPDPRTYPDRKCIAPFRQLLVPSSPTFRVILCDKAQSDKRFENDEDHSYLIADELLNNEGITVVPGSDFGIPNTARIALVIEEVPFQEAITKIVRYLNTLP